MTKPCDCSISFILKIKPRAGSRGYADYTLILGKAGGLPFTPRKKHVTGGISMSSSLDVSYLTFGGFNFDEEQKLALAQLLRDEFLERFRTSFSLLELLGTGHEAIEFGHFHPQDHHFTVRGI